MIANYVFIRNAIIWLAAPFTATVGGARLPTIWQHLVKLRNYAKTEMLGLEAACVCTLPIVIRSTWLHPYALTWASVAIGLQISPLKYSTCFSGITFVCTNSYTAAVGNSLSRGYVNGRCCKPAMWWTSLWHWHHREGDSSGRRREVDEATRNNSAGMRTT